MSGVIDPDIDSLEVMQRQPDGAVNFLAMPYIAGHRQGSLAMSDAAARRFYPPGVAREHHQGRSLVGKKLGDRFPDAHGSARDHHNFSCKFHSALLFLGNWGSQGAAVQSGAAAHFRAESRAHTETAWPPSSPCSRSMSYCFPARPCRCTSSSHGTKKWSPSAWPRIAHSE